MATPIASTPVRHSLRQGGARRRKVIYCLAAFSLAAALSLCCFRNSMQAGLPMSELSWSHNSDRTARICEFCTSMKDCCRELIPSSKPKMRSVQIASSTTPPITNALAIDQWGDSITMPTATAKLAIMATDNSIAWGQRGSREPEKNSLTIYLRLAAVTSWILVIVLAFAKAALNWRKRRRGDH